jgi:hypothetical protein
MMMKKIPLYKVIFALCALVSSGCSNVFFETPAIAPGEVPAAGDILEGCGTIRVELSRGAARTIIPTADWAGLYLEYGFSKDGGTAETKVPADGVFTLEPGTYTLEVKAFADGGQTNLAARGETDTAFSISAGTAAGTVNVSLHPVVTGAGTGTLEYRLEYPADATVDAFTLSRIAGEETYTLTSSASGSGPVVWSGTQYNIPVGYYLLRTALRSGSGATGRVEVVHIYQNLSATVNYIFTDDDFRAYRVTSAADSGPGSLRQALMIYRPWREGRRSYRWRWNRGA